MSPWWNLGVAVTSAEADGAKTTLQRKLGHRQAQAPQRDAIAQPFRLSLILWSTALFVMSTQVGLAQQVACPGKPHAHVVESAKTILPDGSVKTTVICECDDHYEDLGGGCTRASVIGPRPETIIRPLTRAECERGAADQFETDLNSCQRPILVCLKKEGVSARAVECMAPAFALGAALAASVVFDPTKITPILSGVALVHLLSECQSTVRNIAQKAAQICGPEAKKCEDASRTTHTQAMAACSQ